MRPSVSQALKKVAELQDRLCFLYFIVGRSKNVDVKLPAGIWDGRSTALKLRGERWKKGYVGS